MAHELATLEGKVAMAYTGEAPWHQLGTKLPKGLSAMEWMKLAGLDWTVEKLPVYTEVNKNGKIARYPLKTKALWRVSADGKLLDDAPIGEVTTDWETCQNDEQFSFMEEFVAEGGMEMETAGALYDGRMVWALARVKESFEVFGGDRVDSYFLFSNPHWYGKTIDIRFTPIRVVCNNTLTLSLHGKKDLQVKINHKKKFDPEFAKRALGLGKKKLHEYREYAEILGSKKAAEQDVNEYLQRLFIGEKNWKVPTKTGQERFSRNAEIIRGLIEKQPGHEYAEGSWWQPFNALTYYCDHLAGADAERRMEASWFEGNRERKVRGLALALEYASKA